MTSTGVVLMAYGTPTHTDQILPYYTDIRRGRAPSSEQLADLVRRYDAIGGLSPLNDITDAQRAALEVVLDEIAPGNYRVALGFKHIEPSIETAVDSLVDAGADEIVGLVLAPHFSRFSVGQYLDRLDAAATTRGRTGAGLQSWARDPALIEFLADDLTRRLRAMPPHTRVIFSAHSLPQRILASGDPYPDQLRATATEVAEQLGLVEHTDWSLAWQSAGRTPEPWLGPDVNEVIDQLGDDPDTDGVLVCPCGFVSDHLEVLYDLDIEARQQAERGGLRFDRTASVNAARAVMRSLAERIHTREVIDR